MKKLLLTLIIAVVLTVSLVLPLATNAVQAAPVARDGDPVVTGLITITICMEPDSGCYW